jgi:hypothetical protein
MEYLRELQRTLSGKLLFVAIGAALLYISLSVYGVNRAIITDTLTGPYSLHYKTSLLQSILVGSWSMYPIAESIVLSLIAVLLGINIALMVRIFTSMQTNKGLRVTFGGTSVLAIASTGCPACGISILSLVGVSAPFLPIQGVPLQLFATLFLAGSIWYSLRKLQQPMMCEVSNRKNGKHLKVNAG